MPKSGSVATVQCLQYLVLREPGIVCAAIQAAQRSKLPKLRSACWSREFYFFHCPTAQSICFCVVRAACGKPQHKLHSPLH